MDRFKQSFRLYSILLKKIHFGTKYAYIFLRYEPKLQK